MAKKKKTKKRQVRKKGFFSRFPPLSRLDHGDIGLIKIASFAFALWIATLFPEEIALYGQYYLAVFLLACARPFYRYYLK